MKFEAPAGWKIVRLSEIAHVQTGLAKGKVLKQQSVNRPYLRVANVQDGHLDLHEIKTIDVSPSDVKRYALQPGDVLFTEGGDFDKLGRGTVWRGEIEDCLHQNHVFAVRPNASKVLPEFLAAIASSSHGRRYFQLSSKQSTNLASINSTQLKEFPVPLPSLGQQRRIAEILRTWDVALEKLNALRAAKEARLHGAAQLMLEPSRANGPDIVASNWSTTRFGDVFEERQDKNTRLGADDVVTVGKYAIRKQSEHFTRSVASKDLSNYWAISPGDFVYDPMSAYYGAIGRFAGKTNGVVSPAYRVIRLRPGIDPDFMVALLRSHHIRFLLETRSSQGNKEGKRRLLQRDEFASIEFKLPSLDEQRAIAATILTFEADLELTRRAIDAVNCQKRGLMQKLLTGEWRAPLNHQPSTPQAEETTHAR